MPGTRRGLAAGLVIVLAWTAPTAAASTPEDGGADSLARAQQLHSEARAARARGEHTLAATRFEEAFEAMPDGCTPGGLSLIIEADRAYSQAYTAQSDGLQLCENERMLAAALSDGSCTANSGEIDELLRKRRQEIRRNRITCPTATPALRWPDDSLPLAIIDRAPAPAPPVAVAAPIPPPPPRRGPAIGGAVLLGLGAAAVAGVAVTTWRGEQLERSVEGLIAQGTPGCTKDMPSGECKHLDNQGLAMNRLAIASGIMAGALVVSGVVLLIVGRRQMTRGFGSGAVGALPALRWRF